MVAGRFPPQAQLLTTERCNLACRHCAVPEEESPADHELDTPTWEVAIDDLLARGVRSIWFTGGEPVLRRDVLHLIRHALSRGAERVVVVTNGTAFAPVRARQYAELCRSFPRFAVHVSLDGSTRSTHDAIRGAGSWDRTMRGIRNLRQHGGRVRVVQASLTAGNVHELDAFPALLDSLGATGLHLFSLASVGRARNMADEHCSPDAWAGALAIIGSMAAQGFKVSIQGPIDGEDWSPDADVVPRAAGTTTPTVVIGPDGEMFPCPFLRHLRVGNVTDRPGLDASAARLAAITATACTACRYLPMCAGLDLDAPVVERVRATTHPHDVFPERGTPVVLR